MFLWLLLLLLCNSLSSISVTHHVAVNAESDVTKAHLRRPKTR